MYFLNHYVCNIFTMKPNKKLNFDMVNDHGLDYH